MGTLFSFPLFESTASVSLFLKQIGHIRLAALLISITNMPTLLKHVFYFGWMSRVMVTLAVLYAIGKYNDYFKVHIRTIIFVALVLRFVQFYAQPKEYRTLEDLHRNLLENLKYSIESFHLVTEDRVRLHCFSIGKGKKIMLLANGLGSSIYVWEELLLLMQKKEMFEEWKFVSWDYRGLFQSSSPELPARLSLRDHTDDVKLIMDHLQTDVDLLIGWSTGVQIGLQVTLLYPERVKKLALLNGCAGHTLQTALQPIIRLPFLGSVLTDVLTVLRTHTGFLWEPVAQFTRNYHYFVRIAFCRPQAFLVGTRNCEWLNLQYLTDICGVSAKHTGNYIRILQELDAVSVAHLMHEIQVPTLIVTGFLDVLTPAYLSYEMNRVIPKAQLKCYTMSSHFTILEYPHEIADDIINFVEQP